MSIYDIQNRREREREKLTRDLKTDVSYVRAENCLISDICLPLGDWPFGDPHQVQAEVRTFMWIGNDMVEWGVTMVGWVDCQ